MALLEMILVSNHHIRYSISLTSSGTWYTFIYAFYVVQHTVFQSEL